MYIDIFDETGNNKLTNLQVSGTEQVPAVSSVVVRASDIIAAAMAADPTYTMTNDRFFATFTITSPKDKVHGVAVQAIPGGVDRVIPVLDQNNWAQ